jgi:hypothetical protein
MTKELVQKIYDNFEAERCKHKPRPDEPMSGDNTYVMVTETKGFIAGVCFKCNLQSVITKGIL